MFVQAVGVLAVASIGRPARWLDISDAIGSGTEDTKERFRVHGAGANFGVVGLLENAPLVSPEVHEFENEILKGKAGDLFLKFYFSFQETSKSSRIPSLRSAWCSIQLKPASRSSRTGGSRPSARSKLSSRSLAKRSASSRASNETGFMPWRRCSSPNNPGW